MKFTRQELNALGEQEISIDEDLAFSADEFGLNHRLRRLASINLKGTGHFDVHDQLFYVDAVVSGLMIVPCAITLEDVDYPFSADFTAVFVFDPLRVNGDLEALDTDSLVLVENDLADLRPLVYQTILLEIPLKVVKPGLEHYPSGEGWEVIKEEDYDARKRLDPRLEKLKDFKSNDE